MFELSVHYLTLVIVYAIIAVGLDVLVGQMRLLSVAQAAFVGIGGYAAAWAALWGGTPLYVCLVVGCISAGIIGMFMGLLCRGLRGDFLVLAMLAFQMVLSSVFENWTEVTGGAMGMAGIAPASSFGVSVVSGHEVAIVSALALMFCVFLRWRIADGPVGRLWLCLGQDYRLAASFGKNAAIAKLAAIALAGAVAGLGGALYAAYTTYVDPALFSVAESVMLLSMVIIGGTGKLYGPIAGAATVILLPEALRYFALSGVSAGPVRQATYGLLLVTIMLARPRGLVGGPALSR